MVAAGKDFSFRSFCDNIINFGCADNVFGGIGEHKMKPNVKDPG